MASRRLLVLAFVREYIERWGQGPSQREIAAGLDISRTRVRELVRALVSRGHLLRTPGPRGLALPEVRDAAVRHLRELGWMVDEDVASARHPRPQSTLLALPPLSYSPAMATENESGEA